MPNLQHIVGLGMILMHASASCLASEPTNQQLESLIVSVAADAQLSRATSFGNVAYVSILDEDPTESLLNSLRDMGAHVERGSASRNKEDLRFVISKLEPIDSDEVDVTVELRCYGMCSAIYSYAWKLTEEGWKINSTVRIKVN